MKASRPKDLLQAVPLVGALGSLIGCGSTVQEASPEVTGPSVLRHSAARIDGTAEPLSAYEGKVLLIVNTASRCGFTPQYESLQSLYEARRDEGLVILGFPSNDFMGQEPGSNEEIAEFCDARFSITFPMFEKVDVKGDDAHPLFQQLAEEAGSPSWNFNKYLVDRSGHVVARYGSRVAPDDAALTERLDELLATGG